MKQVLILGAGFGGLELAARLSESLSDRVRVTLIDRSDAFVFGFSKLEILFGRQTREEVSCHYRHVSLPAVEFRQENVTAIDPTTRHVTTDAGTYEPDILAVALGADYDPDATPGFVSDGHEFYSPTGAEHLREVLASFTGGKIILAVLGIPFKCPPAPYEGALLLHDYLVGRGIRDVSPIQLITPTAAPIPVSVQTSEAIVDELHAREIGYTPSRRVSGIDPSNHVAHTRTGDLPYDLFIGVPVHVAPPVVVDSGLTEGGNDGWVAVDRRTLATRYPGVYALGDCADAPVPRAGVFAESAARVVAEDIARRIHGSGEVRPYQGAGSCYIEFGGGRVGKVDADFLSGPSPVAPLMGPSLELMRDKQEFAASRRRRWFGL